MHRIGPLKAPDHLPGELETVGSSVLLTLSCHKANRHLLLNSSTNRYHLCRSQKLWALVA